MLTGSVHLFTVISMSLKANYYQVIISWHIPLPDRDDSSCATCLQVLEELENIDDDTDRIGVSFVKTQDLKVAERYGVTSVPALLYFEHQVPTVYEGTYI